MGVRTFLFGCLLLPLQLAQLACLALAAWCWLAAQESGGMGSSAAAGMNALYGLALAAAAAATSSALALRVGALLLAQSASARGWAVDGLLAWRLHAALLTQCSCGALLAPLWRVSRAAVRASLAASIIGAAAAGDTDAQNGLRLLNHGWSLYDNTCAATCAAG
jgi:hypothetical protein